MGTNGSSSIISVHAVELKFLEEPTERDTQACLRHARGPVKEARDVFGMKGEIGSCIL